MNRWKKLAFALVIPCLAAATWLGYWRLTIGPARSILCINNLRTTGLATFRWMAANKGSSPHSLRLLVEKGQLDPKTLICPQSGTIIESGKFVSDYDSIFDRTGRAVSVLDIEGSSNVMMIWDKKPFHGSAKKPYRHVLFMDGNVRRVPEPDFQRSLEEQDKLFLPVEKSNQQPP